eukprot:CAMPEP_0184704268 /NCGR_PEP_ID=MMETSP0313-20130426/30667_1 /TAXON_ID=2792 /ORGANISM="Porphyridium aerugineum, Strain SAG 1380-2" /LENGTH=101 /DNA_ID=CAMNT_0027165275 /DNA_START=759 /DNA_END=1064 /DNA_ORIENTATION=+
MSDPLAKETQDQWHEELRDASQDAAQDELDGGNELDLGGMDDECEGENDEDDELRLVQDPTIHEGTAKVYMSIVLASTSVAIASWSMSSLITTFLQYVSAR